MAFLLGDAVQAVRLRHPAYADATIVPTITLAAEASRLQRSLIEAGIRAYTGFLATTVPIYLALESNNVPGRVAAGSDGGLPVRERDAPLDATAGFATHFDLENADEILGPFVGSVVIGLTTTVVTLTAAARVVNADVAYYIQIVDGPGFGPDAIRSVNSNGVDSWTVDNFRVDPDNTSVFRLISVVEQELDTDATVITQLPSTRQQAAYLVKLDAQGQPYVDLTTPLVATLREGVPLPPHYMLLGLEAALTVSGRAPTANPVTRAPVLRSIPIYHGTRRRDPRVCVELAAFVEGDRLFLAGNTTSWCRIPNLLLTFVPIPPPFDTTARTVLDTPFLLPDSASEALTAGLTFLAARQAKARGKVDDVTVAMAQSDAANEAKLWLGTLQRRAGALDYLAVRNR